MNKQMEFAQIAVECTVGNALIPVRWLERELGKMVRAQEERKYSCIPFWWAVYVEVEQLEGCEIGEVKESHRLRDQ